MNHTNLIKKYVTQKNIIKRMRLRIKIKNKLEAIKKTNIRSVI
jgi:hypothetical protein